MLDSATHAVTLPAVLDLDTLEVLREELVVMQGLGPVRITAGGVERVATNGLFLLLSAAETAGRNGHGFTLEQPSDTLLAAIDRLGLTERFEGLIVS